MSIDDAVQLFLYNRSTFTVSRLTSFIAHIIEKPFNTDCYDYRKRLYLLQCQGRNINRTEPFPDAFSITICTLLH